MATVYSYPKKIIVYSDYNKERRIAGGENALTLLGTDLEGQFSFIAYKDGAVKVYIKVKNTFYNSFTFLNWLSNFPHNIFNLNYQK